MPNIKSSKKRVQIAERNRLRNVAMKSRMRSAIRAVREAIAAADAAKANELTANAFKAIDKAVKRKVIHKNSAARYKSRLAKRIASLSKSKKVAKQTETVAEESTTEE